MEIMIWIIIGLLALALMPYALKGIKFVLLVLVFVILLPIWLILSSYEWIHDRLRSKR